jgi:hypothetical protein
VLCPDLATLWDMLTRTAYVQPHHSRRCSPSPSPGWSTWSRPWPRRWGRCDVARVGSAGLGCRDGEDRDAGGSSCGSMGCRRPASIASRRGDLLPCSITSASADARPAYLATPRAARRRGPRDRASRATPSHRGGPLTPHQPGGGEGVEMVAQGVDVQPSHGGQRRDGDRLRLRVEDLEHRFLRHRQRRAPGRAGCRLRAASESARGSADHAAPRSGSAGPQGRAGFSRGALVVAPRQS